MNCTVLEGGDDYPVGTLSSEPLCTIADDMTYQERIEAPSGTIYDYDDAIDNQPGYFDYEEWCAWDDPGEGGTCGDPHRSGVRLDSVVVAPDSTVIKNTDRSPSEPISGDIQFSDIDTPMLESQINHPRRCRTLIVCDFDNKSGTSLSGSGDSISSSRI